MPALEPFFAQPDPHKGVAANTGNIETDELTQTFVP